MCRLSKPSLIIIQNGFKLYCIL